MVFSYEKARETAEGLALELGGGEVCRAVQQGLATPEDGRKLVALRRWRRLGGWIV